MRFFKMSSLAQKQPTSSEIALCGMTFNDGALDQKSFLPRLTRGRICLRKLAGKGIL